MYKLIQLYLLLVSLFCPLLLNAQDNPSRLILISGASCAGKSTLTQALVNYLGNDWRTIDRDDLEESGIEEEYLDEALTQEILHNLDAGLNVIVDTQSLESQFNALALFHPFTILVYTPLSTLIKRDEQRQQLKQRSQQRQRYARGFILDTFAQLLTLSKTLKHTVLDQIDPSEITAEIFIYPIHEKTHLFFTEIMQSSSLVNVYPIFPYDLIIRSDRQSVETSVIEISLSLMKIKDRDCKTITLNSRQ